MARRYAQKIKGTEAYEIVTFKQSFHGRTLATLSATGQEKIQDGFKPLVSGFRYLYYNDMNDLESWCGPIQLLYFLSSCKEKAEIGQFISVLQEIFANETVRGDES